MIARSVRRAAGPALPLALGGPLAAVLALTPLLGPGAALGPIGAVGIVAVTLYVAALAMPWPGSLAWALGLLAVEYLASLEVRAAPLDASAPAYAGGWFLCAELGWLGLEARRGDRAWRGRVVAIVAIAIAGSALGAALLLTATVPLRGGAAVTGLGVAAALAVAACLAWLGRR